MYYTYIIWSKKNNIFYKGITSDPQKRLWEHNNNLSRFTYQKGPWELVYFKDFGSKIDALIEEKRIKRLNADSIKRLIKSDTNLCKSEG